MAVVLALLMFLPVCSFGSNDVASYILPVRVGTNAQYLVDSEKAFNFSIIKDMSYEHWLTSAETSPSFGFNAKRVWVRLPLSNSANFPRKLALEIPFPRLDIVESQLTVDGETLAHFNMGNSIPWHLRPVKFRNFIIPLIIEPGKQYTLYLKIETGTALQIPMELWDYDLYFQAQQNQMLIDGCFYGIVILSMLYALILFIKTRYWSYFYYVATVSSIALYIASSDGIAYQYFWPSFPMFNLFSLPSSISMFGFSQMLFAISLLRIKFTALVLYKIKLSVAFSWIILFVASFIFMDYSIIRIVTAFGISSALISVYTGVHMHFLGEAAAKYYLIAWACVLVCFLLVALTRFGVIPGNIMIDNSVKIAACLQTILMALALAERINEDRRAKIIAKEVALEQEKKLHLEKERYLTLVHEAKVNELAVKQEIIQSQAESKAKTEFLATMSHEIRTPMNGVLGMLDLLKHTKLDHQQNSYVNIISQSGNALLAIINDILDYSKIVAEKLELENISFNLENVCFETTAVFSNTAKQKGLELLYFVDKKIPDQVIADPNRIRQVILNLLSNALKFTQSGHVHLAVQHEFQNQDKKDGQLIRVEIRDSGAGISEEQKSKLFESFAQANNSIARNFGGTGLGLSISKRLVELMGGEIGVKSEVGEGTCFWFTVCYEPVVTLTNESNPHEYIRGKKVLVISEDCVESSSLAQQLQTWGMKVKLAASLSDLNSNTANENEECDVIIEVMPQQETSINNSSIRHRVCLTFNSWNETDSEDGKKSLVRSENSTQEYIEHPINSLALHQVLTKQFNLTKPLISSNVELRDEAQSMPERLSDILVLVAEDNRVNQQVISGYLKKMGVKYDMVDNGSEAVELFKKSNNNYDLILMDCEMPVMDGYSATRAIREYEVSQNLTSTIIVALTAHAFQSAWGEADNAGMNQLISKPISYKGLEQLFLDSFGAK